MYHVNLLKPWKTQEALLITPFTMEHELVLQVHIGQDPTLAFGNEGLAPIQRKQCLQLTEDFATVFHPSSRENAVNLT